MLRLALFFHLLITISTGLCTENASQSELQSNVKKLQGHIDYYHVLSDITNKLDSEGPQSKKKVLTEQLSYPKHIIEDVYEAYGGIYEQGAWILTARDTMRCLAQSASMGDLISTLYLAHAFNQTRSVDQGICPLAAQLYEKVFQDLSKISLDPSHPHFSKASYLLAMECDSPVFTNQYWSKIIPNRAEKALKYLENINTMDSILLKSLISLRYDIGPKPSIENFLTKENLKSCPGIFLKFLNLFPISNEDKIEILNKSIKILEHPAFIVKLADIYKRYFEWTKDISYKEKSIDLFEKAGKLGSPVSYMKITSFLAPYTILGSYFDFRETKSLEDLQTCKKYLEKAADLGLPEAFYNLALLEREYNLRLSPNNSLSEDAQERLGEYILQFWKKAAQRGFWGVYEKLERVLDDDDQFFIDYPNLETEKQNLFKKTMNKT